VLCSGSAEGGGGSAYVRFLLYNPFGQQVVSIEALFVSFETGYSRLTFA
jgi:hypothetical protein